MISGQWFQRKRSKNLKKIAQNYQLGLLGTLQTKYE